MLWESEANQANWMDVFIAAVCYEIFFDSLSPAMASQRRDGNMAQGETAGYVQGETEYVQGETECGPNPRPRRKKV